MREGININMGLLALGNVIGALGDPSSDLLVCTFRTVVASLLGFFKILLVETAIQR